MRTAALLLLAAAALTARAGITISTSNDHPEVGQTITVTLVVTDADGPLILDPLPEDPGVEIRIAGPPGRRLIVRDGAVKIEDYLVLEVTPRRAGQFELSGLSVGSGKATWEAPPLRIRVGMPPPSDVPPRLAPAADFRIETEATPRVSWLGQGVEVVYRLLGQGPVLRCVPDAPLDFPGFAALALPAPAGVSLAPDGGFHRWTLSRHLLQPAAPGPRLLPARVFRLALRDGEKLGPESRIVAPDLRLEILAPPAARQPAGWSGLVGDFLLTAKLSPARVAGGEYVELRLRLRGRGHPFGAEPRLSAPPGLELRPPRVTDLTAEPGQTDREWVFPVLAAAPGRYLLGPATLAAFSPAQGDYEILSTRPLELTVTGEGAPVPAGAPVRREGWYLALALTLLLPVAGLLDFALRRSPAARALRAGPAGDDPEALARWLRAGLQPYLSGAALVAPLPVQAHLLAGPGGRALCARLESARFAAAPPPSRATLARILRRCRWRRPVSLRPAGALPAG